MKVKKYVKPELIDLNHNVAHGACTEGSGNITDCGPGNNAIYFCYTHGSSAVLDCYGHGSAAYEYCYTHGDVPGIACSVGNNHF